MVKAVSTFEDVISFTSEKDVASAFMYTAGVRVGRFNTQGGKNHTFKEETSSRPADSAVSFTYKALPIENSNISDISRFSCVCSSRSIALQIYEFLMMISW